MCTTIAHSLLIVYTRLYTNSPSRDGIIVTRPPARMQHTERNPFRFDTSGSDHNLLFFSILLRVCVCSVSVLFFCTYRCRRHRRHSFRSAQLVSSNSNSHSSKKTFITLISIRTEFFCSVYFYFISRLVDVRAAAAVLNDDPGAKYIANLISHSHTTHMKTHEKFLEYTRQCLYSHWPRHAAWWIFFFGTPHRASALRVAYSIH